MRLDSIKPHFPIYALVFKGHSPINGAPIKEPNIPIQIELSPTYIIHKYMRPAGGILDTVA